LGRNLKNEGRTKSGECTMLEIGKLLTEKKKSLLPGTFDKGGEETGNGGGLGGNGRVSLSEGRITGAAYSNKGNRVAKEAKEAG